MRYVALLCNVGTPCSDHAVGDRWRTLIKSTATWKAVMRHLQLKRTVFASLCKMCELRREVSWNDAAFSMRGAGFLHRYSYRS